MGDYIKLDRKIVDWEWYLDVNTCRLFIHFLLKANWKDAKFRGILIPRGSFVSSYSNLADETRLTINEIRTAISHLKSTHEVTVKSHSKFSVFTVNNYNVYQTDNTQEHSQSTGKSQPINNLLTTIEEKKEVKNKKNKDILCPVQEVIEYLNDKAGTSFRVTSATTKALVTARCNDGFTLDDFKSVIDKKVDEWKDTEMAVYIRPSTLFGTKFESYKNQLPGKKRPGFNNIQQNDYDFEALEKELMSN